MYPFLLNNHVAALLDKFNLVKGLFCAGFTMGQALEQTDQIVWLHFIKYFEHHLQKVAVMRA